MTFENFRYFLQGMNIGEAPTPEQWARIKEALDTVVEPPVPAVPYPLPTPRWPSPDPWVYPPIITCGNQQQ